VRGLGDPLMGFGGRPTSGSPIRSGRCLGSLPLRMTILEAAVQQPPERSVAAAAAPILGRRLSRVPAFGEARRVAGFPDRGPCPDMPDHRLFGPGWAISAWQSPPIAADVAKSNNTLPVRAARTGYLLPQPKAITPIPVTGPRVLRHIAHEDFHIAARTAGGKAAAELAMALVEPLDRDARQVGWEADPKPAGQSRECPAPGVFLGLHPLRADPKTI